MRDGQNPHGCGATTCITLIRNRPIGMGTNGGCQCFSRWDRSEEAREDRVQLQAIIRWFTDELARVRSLNDLAQVAYENSADHGFWPIPYEPDRIGTPEQQNVVGHKIALIHSELSEALEDLRRGKMATVVEPSGKVTGFESELVDVLIRTFDLLGALGTDVDSILAAKMEYNKGRAAKHGKHF
jgi:hypothetical protein